MSANLNKLTVSELKKQLVTAGLTVTGRKADLVQRLLDASQGERVSQAQDDQNGKNKGAARVKKSRNKSSASKEKNGALTQTEKTAEESNGGNTIEKYKEVEVNGRKIQMPKSFGEIFLEKYKAGMIPKLGAPKTSVTPGKGKTVKTTRKGNKAETSVKGKKIATVNKGNNKATSKKEGKQSGQGCVGTCKAGKNSACPIKGRGKPSGHVGCTEVDRMLEAMGVNPKNASLCTKAAIMKGHIKITGEAGDLEQAVVEEEGECGHMIIATLGDLLKQPDYAGLDYEDGCENATVTCKECDYGRTYVTSICEGKPSFDSGKFHNHCRQCPGFGQCIGDYREAHCSRCGKHYFRGLTGFSCDNCKKKKQRKPAGKAGKVGKARKAHLMAKIAAYHAGGGGWNIDRCGSDIEEEV